jgi:CheY-like chemotaxis protein
MDSPVDNVLLVSTDRKSRELLPPAIQAEAPGLSIEALGRIGEALSRLTSTRFDAVVCCADSAEELAHVIRIKKANPNLPIILLSRVPDWGFAALAETFGASIVVTKIGDLRETAGSLALALKTRTLAREQKQHSVRSHQVSQEIRRLSHDNRQLVEMALGLTAAQQTQFIILMVEGDLARAYSVMETMNHRGLPPILRSVRTAEEAISYLSGHERFADRTRFPLPGLIVSNSALPGKSGLDLLRWVRSNPDAGHLGFIMLTSPHSDQDISRAYEDGANFHLARNGGVNELVDVLGEIYTQSMNQKLGPNYFPWRPPA